MWSSGTGWSEIKATSGYAIEGRRAAAKLIGRSNLKSWRTSADKVGSDTYEGSAPMVVLADGVEYQLIRPENEQALEEAVQASHTHIFGRESLHFNLKRKMRSTAGVATIPDGYAILFDARTF